MLKKFLKTHFKENYPGLSIQIFLSHIALSVIELKLVTIRNIKVTKNANGKNIHFNVL